MSFNLLINGRASKMLKVIQRRVQECWNEFTNQCIKWIINTTQDFLKFVYKGCSSAWHMGGSKC